MIVREHIDFTRNVDPKDAMQTGDVRYRRMQQAKKQIIHELKDICDEYGATLIDFNEQRPTLQYIKIGFVLAKAYVFYITYSDDVEEGENKFCVGYDYTKIIKGVESSGGDEQCYETASDCIPKLEWWIQNMFIV